MRIAVSSPVRPGSTSGNATTASRWARRLGELGHEVVETTHGEPAEGCDLVVVLHARRGADAVRHYSAKPQGPKIVVAFTGTDVNGDLTDPELVSSVALADAFVFLEPSAQRLADITDGRPQYVIFQAVEPTDHEPSFEFEEVVGECRFAVLSHLREVKDPFRAAEAVAQLPDDSKVRVLHAGAPHDESWGDRARELMQDDPRYQWVGPLDRGAAMRLLEGSRALILSSWSEGGANVVSEAISLGKPVVASRIPGTVGLLGSDYPGYYKAGDTTGLAELLERFSTDPSFERELTRLCLGLSSLVDPDRERGSWSDLIADLGLSAQ